MMEISLIICIQQEIISVAIIVQKNSQLPHLVKMFVQKIVLRLLDGNLNKNIFNPRSPIGSLGVAAVN
jgi:hypothetical protein